MDKRKNIAFILRTIGLEYDDRIRKEAIALSKVANVIIYVNFADNRKKSGTTSYGIPYKSFRLKTRDKLPSAKYLFIKAFEFFLQVRPYLKKSDIVWAHEEYAFMFPLLVEKNKTIWDLHEIPFRFEKGIMKQVFKYIEKKTLFIIHANKHRIDYLYNKKIIRVREKHLFLNNFPDSDFLKNKTKNKKYNDFVQWLDSDKYIYLQGLTTEGRYPYNSIKSIMHLNMKILVVGSFDKNAMIMLRKEFGEEIDQKIYFAGMLNQLYISSYLQNAEFSIILYNTDIPNNKYCEPNRLYQSISMLVPVLVGNNPPMKSVVEKYNIGISLSSDGRDLSELIKKTKLMKENQQKFKNNLEKLQGLFLWDNQKVIDVLKKINF